MVFKKWQKKPAKKKVEVVEETKEEVIEEEIPVSFVEENEIEDDEIPAWTVFSDEQPVFIKRQIGKKIWEIWWSVVSKPKGRIKFEAQVAPYPIFKLPEELRRWIINNWLTTDVYKWSKEKLEKRHVDMEMVEKLKEFLTEVL